MRKTVCPLSVVVLFALGSCTGAKEPEPERPASRCDLAGVWRLTETPVEENCRPEPVDEATLQIENQDGVYALEFRIPDEAAMTCSGVPDLDSCGLEATCSGFLASQEVEVALEVEFHGERLSGRQRVDTRDPSCESTYDVKGERTSPSDDVH
jgi:hypothetical protein